MRHRFKIAAGAAALWFSAATCGLTQPSDFPAALDVRSLTAWIGANTSLPTATIVSVGVNSIIGLRSAVLAGPDRPGVYHAQIWSEVISRPAAAAGGYMSWSADIDVDCQSRRSKATRIQNFPLRNLGGVSRELPGSPDWVSPTVGTQLYSLIASVCDPNYKRPLSATKLAAAPPAPAAGAPAVPEGAHPPSAVMTVAPPPKEIVIAEAPKPASAPIATPRATTVVAPVAASVAAPPAPIVIARAEPPPVTPLMPSSARVEAAPRPVERPAPAPILEPAPTPAPLAVVEPTPMVTATPQPLIVATAEPRRVAAVPAAEPAEARAGPVALPVPPTPAVVAEAPPAAPPEPMRVATPEPALPATPSAARDEPMPKPAPAAAPEPVANPEPAVVAESARPEPEPQPESAATPASSPIAAPVIVATVEPVPSPAVPAAPRTYARPPSVEPDAPRAATPPPIIAGASPSATPRVYARPPSAEPYLPSETEVAKTPSSPALAAARAGDVAVQVSAATTPALARREIVQVQARFSSAARLSNTVVEASVGGRTVHRALFYGFSNRNAAAAWCDTLQNGGQACFVRRDFNAPR